MLTTQIFQNINTDVKNILKKALSNEEIIPEDKPELTDFRKILSKKLAERDSTESINRKGISIQSIKDNTIITSEQDTFVFDEYEIDINNYIFEKEKINY